MFPVIGIMYDRIVARGAINLGNELFMLIMYGCIWSTLHNDRGVQKALPDVLPPPACPIDVLEDPRKLYRHNKLVAESWLAEHHFENGDASITSLNSYARKRPPSLGGGRK